MLCNVNFQIWFKVCRPLKPKYKLSTNCLLVLNGVYVYGKLVNQTFTRRQMMLFVSYYDTGRILSYLTVLVSHNYIIETIKKGNRQYYSLSPLGLQVIKELNESYNSELSKFISKYNIVL